MNNRKQLIHYTRELFLAGINNGANGNFSFRENKNIFITHSGSVSSELTIKDLVKITSPLASSEKQAHEFMYQQVSELQAIFHTHSLAAIALSLRTKTNKIIPIDMEGNYHFKEIPIIKTELIPGAKDLPQKLLTAYKTSPAVIVKGHGVFVFGKSIKDCYLKTITVNNICQLML